jgi:hypothetical protein
MSPELLSRFEPVAREQLKQVVTNSVSQFFTADSFKVEGKDPLVITFLYAPRRDATMLDPTPLRDAIDREPCNEPQPHWA